MRNKIITGVAAVAVTAAALAGCGGSPQADCQSAIDTSVKYAIHHDNQQPAGAVKSIEAACGGLSKAQISKIVAREMREAMKEAFKKAGL
ncbi:MAG: hypothetical protein LBV34_15160 [Nocardiopsaceae bacterium]|jgi:uncharacterized protein YoaH (UPF0181 family)|nr:hypothetical protein [Nocardiopsaceae bacterium]